jgi:hypothetical protein
MNFGFSKGFGGIGFAQHNTDQTDLDETTGLGLSTDVQGGVLGLEGRYPDRLKSSQDADLSVLGQRSRLRKDLAQGSIGNDPARRTGVSPQAVTSSLMHPFLSPQPHRSTTTSVNTRFSLDPRPPNMPLTPSGTLDIRDVNQTLIQLAQTAEESYDQYRLGESNTDLMDLSEDLARSRHAYANVFAATKMFQVSASDTYPSTGWPASQLPGTQDTLMESDRDAHNNIGEAEPLLRLISQPVSLYESLPASSSHERKKLGNRSAVDLVNTSEERSLVGLDLTSNTDAATLASTSRLETSTENGRLKRSREAELFAPSDLSAGDSLFEETFLSERKTRTSHKDWEVSKRLKMDHVATPLHDAAGMKAQNLETSSYPQSQRGISNISVTYTISKDRTGDQEGIIQSNDLNDSDYQPVPYQDLSPLSLSDDSRTPAQVKQDIGEALYPKVRQVQPELAGKITGMLLEMDNDDLRTLIDDHTALLSRINEARAVYDDYVNSQTYSAPLHDAAEMQAQNPKKSSYPQSQPGVSNIFVTYTISEDRTGDQEEIMVQRLAALGSRFEMIGDGHRGHLFLQSNDLKDSDYQPVPYHGPSSLSLSDDPRTPAQVKQDIGEALYPKVRQMQPELAGKITGMLLEMDNDDLRTLIDDHTALLSWVNEARAVYDDYVNSRMRDEMDEEY